MSIRQTKLEKAHKSEIEELLRVHIEKAAALKEACNAQLASRNLLHQETKEYLGTLIGRNRFRNVRGRVFRSWRHIAKQQQHDRQVKLRALKIIILRQSRKFLRMHYHKWYMTANACHVQHLRNSNVLLLNRIEEQIATSCQKLRSKRVQTAAILSNAIRRRSKSRFFSLWRWFTTEAIRKAHSQTRFLQKILVRLTNVHKRLGFCQWVRQAQSLKHATSLQLTRDDVLLNQQEQQKRLNLMSQALSNTKLRAGLLLSQRKSTSFRAKIFVKWSQWSASRSTHKKLQRNTLAPILFRATKINQLNAFRIWGKAVKKQAFVELSESHTEVLKKLKLKIKQEAALGLQNLQKHQSHHKAEIQHLKEVANEKQLRLSENISSLKYERDILKSQNASDEASLQNFKSKYETVSAKNEDLVHAVRSHEVKESNQMHMIESLTSEVKQLQESNIILKATVSAKEDQIRALNESNLKLKVESESQLSKSMSKVVTMEAEFKARMAEKGFEYEKQLAAMKEASNIQLSLATAKLRDLDQSLTELRSQAEYKMLSVQSEHAQETVNLKAAFDIKLAAVQNEANESIKSAQQLCRETETQIKEALNNEKRNVQQHSLTIGALERRLAASKLELVNMATKVSSCEQLKASSDETLAAVRQKLAQLQAERNYLQKDLDRERKQLGDSAEELRKKREEYHELARRLEENKQASEDAFTKAGANHEEEVIKLRTQIRETVEEAALQRNRNLELSSKFELKERKMSQDLQNLGTKIAAEREKYIRQGEKHLEIITNLEAELKSTNENNAKMKNAVSTAKTDMEACTKRISEVSRESEAHKQKSEQMGDRLHAIESEKREALESLQSCKDETALLVKHLAKEKTVAEFLQNKYDEALSALDDLKRRHHEELIRVREENNSLATRERQRYEDSNQMLGMRVADAERAAKNQAISTICGILPRHFDRVSRKRFNAWKTHASVQTALAVQSRRVLNEKRAVLEDHRVGAELINRELSEMKAVVAQATQEKLSIMSAAKSLKASLQSLSGECSAMRTERTHVVSGLTKKCDGLEREVTNVTGRLNNNLRSTSTLELECKILRKGLLEKEEKIESMGRLLHRSQELMKSTRRQLDEMDDKARHESEKSAAVQEVYKLLTEKDKQLDASKNVGSRLMKELHDAKGEIVKLKQVQMNFVGGVLNATAGLETDLRKSGKSSSSN